MDDILIKAEDLAIFIKNNNIYTDYAQAYENLKNSPEIFKKVSDFKKIQIENRYSDLKNINNDFGVKKYLSKLYSDLMLNEIACEFFLKESILLTAYENVCEVLANEIKIDLFELN